MSQIIVCQFCRKRTSDTTIEVLENYIICTKPVCRKCINAPEVLKVLYDKPPVHYASESRKERERVSFEFDD